jgi:DNA replication protein DnaC
MELENIQQFPDLDNGTPPTSTPLDSNELQIHKIAVREDAVKEFQLLVGRKYESSTLENFQCSLPIQTNTVRALENYADNIVPNLEAGTNIILNGPCGTGKDHLLIGSAKTILLRAGESREIRKFYVYHQIATGIQETVDAKKIKVLSIHIDWKNGMDLFGDMRDLMDNKYLSEEKFIESMILPDILILSDPIPPRGSITDFQSQMLFRVLDARYRRCTPTWVTLNVRGAQEADERMGAQLVDRLRDGALSIHCDWPSYRKVSQSI